jgi:ribosomal protein S18 acetylase RimI-like enzyme
MFSAEIYHPSPAAWNAVKDDVVFLERQAFKDKAFSPEEIEKDFLNERNTIALLKDGAKVIGFTYARPLDEADEPGRESEAAETCYIWDTVIGEEYRGRHLVGGLTGILEQELKRRGYSYMERTSMVANNYAANIARSYGDRIVRSEPKTTQYGEQVFFRIRL